ncbi:VOC family protein [Tropicimonas aquimaris]|uniref:VOC family protein n=1 Tax=Tropicimonas aquimaris TaxID=914152 RepID=A0ABW3ILJ6_9RHOB
MSLNHGAIWWSELMTRDLPGSVKYYEDVCGWSFEDLPAGEEDYRVAVAHGRPVAGIRDVTGLEEFEGDDPHWFTYIAVDDIDAALERTRFAGGRVMQAPMDVAGVGRIALVSDAGGAPVGLLTPVFPTDDLVAEDLRHVTEAELDEDNFPV